MKRLARVVGALVLASYALAVGPAWAAAGGPGPGSGAFDPGSGSEDNHCLAPGGDANQILGVSEQIIGGPGCFEADSGEFYIPLNFWYTNFAFDVVPEGYVAAGDTPMEDFLAKVESIRFVVDGGTHRERTFVFAPDGLMKLDTFDEFLPWMPPFPIVHVLAKLPPLPPGDHTVQTLWTMSSLHCDGFGTVHRTNCFPEGETAYSTLEFSVVRGASQSAHK